MSELTREAVDAKLDATESRLEATMKTGFAELRIDIEKMRPELHQAIGSLIKWCVALSLAVVGTTVGLLHLISKAS